MTDANNPSNTLASAFPAPPPFYKHFTPTNLSRLREAQTQDANPSTTSAAPQLSPTLPLELLYLIPPSPPDASTTTRTFSTPHNLTPNIPTLSSRNLEQLTPHASLTPPHPNISTDQNTNTPTNPTPALLQLTRSTLLSFLELIALLSHSPSLALQKTEDLRVLFVNLHDLVNRQRAHGAREALIAMMEGEVLRRKGEVERIRNLGVKVDEMMIGLGRGSGGLGVDEGGGGVGERVREGVWDEEEMRKEKEKRILDALDSIDIG